ncbi:ATP-binding cassette sub-family A member 3 [Elysia marginata]|uniref:ATP-binding cassette sub-family A member 3 n=1 Tax=Elysia marginata TaxID=1093978 RepID=A0AAV4EHW5_9GAST|nr:ATP-binding cassette sub-family A member 3 [Elysia marginata]
MIKSHSERHQKSSATFVEISLYTNPPHKHASGRFYSSLSSMEECDALCTKLVILLHGRPMCLGSPQHLKNKYGQGYTLVIKMGTLADGTIASTEPVVEFIQKAFPETVVSVKGDHRENTFLGCSFTSSLLVA